MARSAVDFAGLRRTSYGLALVRKAIYELVRSRGDTEWDRLNVVITENGKPLGKDDRVELAVLVAKVGISTACYGSRVLWSHSVLPVVCFLAMYVFLYFAPFLLSTLFFPPSRLWLGRLPRPVPQCPSV